MNNYFQSPPSIHYKLSTIHFIWAFRLSPSGFPLYLCSLFVFPRSLKIWARRFDRLSDLAPFPSPIPVPKTLAKDAAPIPNALAAIKNLKLKFEN